MRCWSSCMCQLSLSSSICLRMLVFSNPVRCVLSSILLRRWTCINIVGINVVSHSIHLFILLFLIIYLFFFLKLNDFFKRDDCINQIIFLYSQFIQCCLKFTTKGSFVDMMDQPQTLEQMSLFQYPLSHELLLHIFQMHLT